MRRLVRLLQQRPVSSFLGFAAFAWGLVAVVLLSWPSAPTVGVIGGAGQHLALGLVLSLIGGGAVADWTKWHAASVGWVGLAGTTVLLFLLELVQMPVPGRSFQWADLSFGASGAVIGGAIVTLGTLRWRRSFTRVVASGGTALLLATCVAVLAVAVGRLDATSSGEVERCSPGPDVGVDWSLVTIDFPSQDGNCIQTVIGPLAAGGGGSDARPDGLQLTGGGVISGPLDGLRSAITGSGEVTFGVRFTAAEVGDVGPPVVLARLIIDDDSARPLLQILQRGPHLASNIGSGRPTVGIGSVLADTIKRDVRYEYVVTYANGEAVTYLDGAPVARSTVPPMRFELDAPLSLEVGRRSDEAWDPFIGTIDAVLIADRALAPGEVGDVFGPR